MTPTIFVLGFTCVVLALGLLYLYQDMDKKFKETNRAFHSENNDLRASLSEIQRNHDWQPPTIDQIVGKLVTATESYKSRCPHCSRIMPENRKTKFCPGCGEQFLKERPKKLPRILSAAKAERKVRYNQRKTTSFADLKWQCLECGEEHTKEWELAKLQNSPFIFVMHCDNCDEEVGDVIVDKTLLNVGKTWAINVEKHGSLRLEDYARPKEETVS